MRGARSASRRFCTSVRTVGSEETSGGTATACGRRDPQPIHAAHTQPRVHDSHIVVHPAHPGRADGVEDGGGDLAG